MIETEDTPGLISRRMAELQAKHGDKLKPELTEEQKEIMHQNRVAELRRLWNAPKRQVERTNLNRSGEWGKVEKAIKSKLGTGFLYALIGGNGPGKTQMGVELMREATNRLQTAFCATAVGFFLDLKANYGRKDARSEDSVIDQYARYSLLVLDEIGQRGETEWEDRILFEMLNRRYNNMKDTLLISNQGKEEFEAAIGNSIASRMNETGGIIQCNWPSFRD